MGTNRLLKYGEAPQLDGLGSMRQGVNTSSGVFTGQTDYSAFGEVIGGNNTGASQSVYQWQAQSGYRMDGGSGGGGDCGLVKVGARYYDPAVGRFTSRDSDITQSAYVYCNGDPVNCNDPSGHSFRVNGWAAIGGFIGLAIGIAVVVAVASLLPAFAVIVGASEIFAATGITGGLVSAAFSLAGAAVGGDAAEVQDEQDKIDEEYKDPREPVAPKGGIPGSVGGGSVGDPGSVTSQGPTVGTTMILEPPSPEEIQQILQNAGYGR